MDDSALLPIYGARDLTVSHGEGAYLFDTEGHRYLDCVGGVAVNALGHCHPAIVAAIEAQSKKFIHASNLYLLPTQMQLAQRLCEATGLDRVFFSNSGAEANEGALKFARRFFVAQGQSQRQNVITFAQSFHGRTYGAMTATGQDKIKQGFGPLPGGYVTVQVNDVAAFNAIAHESTTAAVLVEPILAEGGILEHSPEMITAIKAAQANGVLLIADEIQTGLGRTGSFLASQALGLKPDLVTLAKPLGGGLPLGAILLREPIAATLKQGDHGSTFGGNPVACAAGLAVLEVILAPGFLQGMNQRAAILHDKLGAFVKRQAALGKPFGGLRGRGFLLGFQYGGDLTALIKAMRNEGVLVYRAGADVLRLLPPLILSEAQIDQLLMAFERVMIA